MERWNEFWRPDALRLRRFGFFGAALFAAVGMYVFFVHALPGWSIEAYAAQVLGMTLWAVGAAMLLSAMLLPQGLRPMYLCASVLLAPVFWAVAMGALAAIFVLVITPVGLVQRLVRPDPLQRRFEPTRKSYWQPTDPPPSGEQYYRQS